MKKIATKDKRIGRRINSMDPARGNEESVASLQINTATLLDQIAEKYIALFSGQSPLFIQLQISLRRGYQPENLKCRFRLKAVSIAFNIYCSNTFEPLRM